MNTLIEKLQIVLADAEETVTQYEEKGIPDARVKGKVEGLKEALGIVEGYAREQGGFWE